MTRSLSAPAHPARPDAAGPARLRPVPPVRRSAPVALLVLTEDGRLLPPTADQLEPLRALAPRAAAPARPSDEVLERGPLVVRPAAHTATIDGHRLPLTVREFDVLVVLARADGRTVARAELLAAVGGTGSGPRTVDVHVARLRAKLGDAADRLVTVRGRGYQWDAA